MRITCDPGVTIEPGRYTALVGPPGFLLDILSRPEIDRFSALYLYGVGSRVLQGLPRRAPRLALQSCMTVHQLLASLREADQTFVIVEYDDDIFSPLEGDDRDVIFVVARTLCELARTSAVLLYAPRGDRGLRALVTTADQVVWRYREPPPSPPGRPGGRRRVRTAQATLADAGPPGRA